MNIKLFLKAVLLYSTIAVCIIAAACIDSLLESKWDFIQAAVVITGLICWCKSVITKEDCDTIFPINDTHRD